MAIKSQANTHVFAFFWMKKKLLCLLSFFVFTMELKRALDLRTSMLP